MSTTTADDNKAMLRRLTDAFNSRDRQVIAESIDLHFHPDVLIRTPLKVDATGKDLMKQLWDVLLRGFPDLQVTVEDAIAEGDRIVSRNTVTGTHRGDYMGVPATNRVITWQEIFIIRISDGQVAESWGVVDSAAQMRQLGILPG